MADAPPLPPLKPLSMKLNRAGGLPGASPPPLPGASLTEGSIITVNGSAAQILAEVIDFAHRERISDLQLQSGRLVYANGGGSTRPYERWGILSAEVLTEMLELMYASRAIFEGFEAENNQPLLERMLIEKKLDFACEGQGTGSVLGEGRFRVQAHFSHQGVGMTIRPHSTKFTPFDQLGLPAQVAESIRQKVTKKQGMGLVVGPTGSGKTSTLVALIDWVRHHHHKHIVTIEDPIEYCYANTIKAAAGGGTLPSPALVTQQEVGYHVRSFEQGLNDALRKKPDIILVGEIRTAETLRIALEAAETGHYILSTLHTRGAGKTLGRMRQMFSLEQARGILQQFADVGSFILSQGLMPDINGRYVLCCEYFSIQEIEDRNAIRKYAEGAFQDVEERLIKTYNRKWNTELKELLNAKRITPGVYEEFYQVTGMENK